MDSFVHIIISAHTWPATNTDVKDPSKRCVTEPHMPTQRPLMAPVKTTSHAWAASLISSPNYCGGCLTPCIERAFNGQTHRSGKWDCYFFFFFFWLCRSWSQYRQLLLLVSGFMYANTCGHYNYKKKKNPNKWEKNPKASVFFPHPGCSSMESQVWRPNGGCENKPLSSKNTQYVTYKH